MVTKVRTLDRLYADRELFTSKDMFSPPSERLPHVIRFELTTGCNWRKCSYCEGFDGIRHGVKTLEEYRMHVDNIFDRMSPELKRGLTRVFIGGGNALEVDTEDLKSAFYYTGVRFRDEVSKSPKRMSIYGRTDSIRDKGSTALDNLHYVDRYFGLDLIYWGVESGATPVLEYVNKGCTRDDILEAADAVRHSKVNTSIMIMPGLGGIRHHDDHVSETVKVINAIQPQFLTFMGVNPSGSSAYAKKMRKEDKEGVNRPLTPYEMATQMIQMIKEIQPVRRMKIGCFNQQIDGVGCNPLTFGSANLYDRYDSRRFAERLEYSSDYDRLKRS